MEDLEPKPCKYAQALGELLETYTVSESMSAGHLEKLEDDSLACVPDNDALGEYKVVIPGPVTTPSLIRMLDPQKTYPYIVIKYMPGCYGAFPVEFVSDESQQTEHEDSWHLVVPDPYEKGELTPEAREAVLDITEVAFNRMRGRFGMCAVFADDDCVYFELDGSIVQHTSAPSMTIDLGNDPGD